MNKYVVFYEAADDMATKAPPAFPAHTAHIRQFREQGSLLGIGAFANPMTEGSMAIFNSREAAEKFASGDPMVVQGAVKRWVVREWQELTD
jgi:uncharacterized protein YciI